jgi:lipopolysaccharide export system permease protein
MIFDRYIFLSLLKPFSAGVAASFVLFFGNMIFFFMEMINKANVPIDIVLKFFLYNIPEIIVLSFPIGFLFATLLVLGGLSRDYEITALNSCGVNFNRIITPVIFMSLFISGLSFFINEKVVPYYNNEKNNLQLEILNNPKVMPVKERVFLNSKENRYFYVEKIDKEKNTYKDIMVFDNYVNPNKKNTTQSIYPRIISAKTAKRKEGKWILYNGSFKNFDKYGNISYETSFKEMELSFKIDKNNLAYGTTPTNAMDMDKTKKQLSELKKKGIDTKSIEVQYQLKMSIPLATFFVTLIGAPIGIRFAKKGTYFGVSICIALVFLWHIIHTYSTALGNEGTIHPIIAAWIQNIIFAVIGISLIIKSNDS